MDSCGICFEKKVLIHLLSIIRDSRKGFIHLDQLPLRVDMPINLSGSRFTVTVLPKCILRNRVIFSVSAPFARMFLRNAEGGNLECVIENFSRRI